VLIIGGCTDKTKSVHLDSFQPISISLWPLFQRESSLRYEYRFSDILKVDFITIKILHSDSVWRRGQGLHRNSLLNKILKLFLLWIVESNLVPWAPSSLLLVQGKGKREILVTNDWKSNICNPVPCYFKIRLEFFFFLEKLTALTIIRRFSKQLLIIKEVISSVSCSKKRRLFKQEPMQCRGSINLHLLNLVWVGSCLLEGSLGCYVVRYT